MASLFKKTYSAPIPANAEFVTVRGIASARFRDSGNKVVTAPLTKNGKRIRLYSEKWYGRYTGQNGESVTVPLFTDKVSSGQRLAELVCKSQRRQTGVADPFEDHRERSIAEHVDDYRRFLEAEDNIHEHVARTISKITSIIDGCRFRFITDLASERVAEYLHGLRRDPHRPVLPVGQEWFTPDEFTAALAGNRPAKLSRIIERERLESPIGHGENRRYPRSTVERFQDLFCRGVSITTSNAYASAIKSFSRWLVVTERTDRDRLVSLSRLNASADIRHQRRALEEVDVNNLIASTWTSNTMFEGLTGQDRSMLYSLAMATGLRASELASLSPSSFFLGADRPTVKVRAAYTKNRIEAEQPLPPDVAARRCRRIPRVPCRPTRVVCHLAWEMERIGRRDVAG